VKTDFFATLRTLRLNLIYFTTITKQVIHVQLILFVPCWRWEASALSLHQADS